MLVLVLLVRGAESQGHHTIIAHDSHQDDKPYILQFAAGEAGPDARSRGWNLVAKSTFSSKEDMDYYDSSCEAHQTLKKLVAQIKEDVMTVWYESAVDARL